MINVWLNVLLRFLTCEVSGWDWIWALQRERFFINFEKSRYGFTVVEETRRKTPFPKLGKPSSVQFSSVAQSCPAFCDPMNDSTPGLPVYHKLLESAQTHAHWVGDAIQPSHPLFSLVLLPPILPSIRVFSNESTLHMRWPKYWSFSFSISPSNEPPGLISFWMDWLDLLAVQGTLKSLLQHHSSKA